MLISQPYHYEDVKVELERYLNEKGPGRNREPGATRPMSLRVKVALALIPLLIALGFVV